LIIPEFSGVTTRAIIDTMINKSFVAFVGVFLFIIISFAVTYHLAFGNDLFDNRDIERSVLKMLRMIFGEFDYQALEDNNRVFGPLLFSAFMIFVALILMNMFIAVISDIYVTVHNKHIEFWEINMTKLIIIFISEKRGTTIWTAIWMSLIRLKARLTGKRSFTFYDTNPAAWVEQEVGAEDDANAIEMESLTRSLSEMEIINSEIKKEREISLTESEVDTLVFKYFQSRTEKSSTELYEKMNQLHEVMARENDFRKAELSNLKRDMQYELSVIHSDIAEIKRLLLEYTKSK